MGQVQLVEHRDHARLHLGDRSKGIHPVVAGEFGPLERGVSLGGDPARAGRGSVHSTSDPAADPLAACHLHHTTPTR
jgi:hypothetical protein